MIFYTKRKQNKKLIQWPNLEDRSEDDALTIERILVLVRNVLQVPRDVRSEKRTDDDATVHDQV